MKITVREYKEIRARYLKGQSQRQIAKELGIARQTVKKYCEGATVPWAERHYTRKPAVLTDEIVAFIEDCLDEDDRENLKKQKHTAKRIFDRLVEEKGFQGGESTIRRKVKDLRETRVKAFIPLQFEPGEAMQVDWGEAKIYKNSVRVKIYIFCARLCYSCRPLVYAYSHQNEESFLDAYVRIFNFLNGVPAKVIFDNAKVAVFDGYGAHAEMQGIYSLLCAHYGFEAAFCNRASGNEKGLVEGLVGWARRNILVPVPRVENLGELNEVLEARCTKYESMQIRGKPDTVAAMYEIEKGALLPLPTYPFVAAKSVNARVNTFCLVRFQTNEYSVPARYVGRQVGVRGYPETVAIYYEGEQISEHERLWGKNERSCRLVDYLDLLKERGRAVLNAVPVKQTLSKEAFEELRANIKNPEKVKEILYREASLPRKNASKGTAKAEEISREDPVKIKEVNLEDYDTLVD